VRESKQLIWLVVLVAVLVGINLYRSVSQGGKAGGGAKGSTPAASAYTIPDADFDTAALQEGPAVRAADIKRNIFDYGSVPVARRAPAVSGPPKGNAPPPPPPPEPKPPLRFFGFARGGAAGVHRVFLTDGDAVFVAQEGQVVMRRYKVLHIQAQSVEVEDVTAARRWVLPLEQP
jgi:hypothetical protein